MTSLEIPRIAYRPVLAPGGEPEIGIAPLERLVAPDGLDGRRGVHRFKVGCRIDADDDRAALDWWVTRTSNNEVTASGRRSAVEKLLNWSCFVRGKAVSSLDEQDFAAFADFLTHPEPMQTWIGSCQSRASTTWKPFTKPLAGRAQQHVLKRISALVGWLSSQRYAELRFTYGTRATKYGEATVATRGAEREVQPAEPVSVNEWHWIRRLMDRDFPPEDLAVERAFIELLYYGNLYVGEVAKLQVKDCEPPNRLAPGWMLSVPTRSDIRGGETVFAAPPLSDTIERWMRHHEVPREGYLILRLRNSSQSLFESDGETVARKARQVLRLAAGLALERGDVINGMRLRDRSVRALRGAFSAHQRARPLNQGAIELTGKPFKFGRSFNDRNPPRWDWSRAEHLWTEQGEGAR